MKIKGKVHCFFEQSGTFKNEFIKLGITAEDYDIQNNYGETDHVLDLFNEIDKSYGGQKSIFDTISKDDLILAFFPCIYFSCLSSIWYSLDQRDYKKWPERKIIDNILLRNKNRSFYFEILNKFCCIVIEKKLRMIFENPFSENHFLKFGFLKPPTVIDKDRTRRGDFFVKPTGFWFWNCEPTQGTSYQKVKTLKTILNSKKAKKSGVCSEERSMISQDYARNFICDFIIGKKQEIGQLSLF
jgi:hypothetical protein